MCLNEYGFRSFSVGGLIKKITINLSHILNRTKPRNVSFSQLSDPAPSIPHLQFKVGTRGSEIMSELLDG